MEPDFLDSLEPRNNCYNNFWVQLKAMRNTPCRKAARHGDLAELKRLHEEEGEELTSETFSDACNNLHMDMIRYLLDKKCPHDEYASQNAAMNGHLRILKMLHENKCTFSPYVVSEAARNGHKKVVKWAVKQGYKVNTYACECAAVNDDNIDILRFLYKKGVPLYEKCTDVIEGEEEEVYRSVVDGAAMYKSYDCLVFAVERGCPVDQEDLNNSISYKSIACFKYLIQHVECGWNAGTIAKLISNGWYDEADDLLCESDYKLLLDFNELCEKPYRYFDHSSCLYNFREECADCNGLKRLQYAADSNDEDEFQNKCREYLEN